MAVTARLVLARRRAALRVRARPGAGDALQWTELSPSGGAGTPRWCRPPATAPGPSRPCCRPTSPGTPTRPAPTSRPSSRSSCCWPPPSDAGARLATREAIGHYRRALERVDVAGPAGPDQRSTWATSSTTPASGTRRRRLPERGGRRRPWPRDDPQLLARVALTAYRHRAASARAADGSAYNAEALLREAHRRLVGDEPHRTRRRTQLLRDLVARTELLARRDADDEALTFSLWARHDAHLGPGHRGRAGRAHLGDARGRPPHRRPRHRRLRARR